MSFDFNKNSTVGAIMMTQEMLKKRLDAMIDSLSSERLRWLIDKGKPLVEEEKMKSEEYEKLMEDILKTEMERKMIINELKSKTLITSEISMRLQMSPKKVFNLLIAFRRYNVVTIIGERDGELEFQLL